MRIDRLNRRQALRTASVCIGLPWLEAMLPSVLRAESAAAANLPKRMLLIGRPLGLHTPNLFPEDTGPDYRPSRYLKVLEPLRGAFTVFSGMSHRGYASGHQTTAGLFTGVGPEGMRSGDIRNTISLDQKAAAHLGGDTRYASLVLGGGELSWNRKGLRVPSESRATQVFKELFLQGTPAEVAREVQRIQTGQSILDGVRNQARSLAQSLGANDRNRIDLLLTSIREAEARLQQDQQWITKPKPAVDAKPFTDDYITGGRMLERSRQWFDLVDLALHTDSTRVISLYLWSHEPVVVDGTMIGHHDMSHHGKDEQKLKQLAIVEEAEIALFADFLGKLKATDEAGATLLDRTQIAYASNLGNASAHTCDNLPILLAGGGFRHAGHVAYDAKDNMPFSNLFVRMLQQLGIERDHFGSSTSKLDEV